MEDRDEASLSSAESRIARRSRCAEMNDNLSSPRTVGGMSVPEFDKFWVGERDVASRDVAAETADARRE